ncbi:patatin-like phospholipase family protein [Aquabacter sp. CN5-332]|uniref:patatin-like phospholipase family protein n=1 Tax=Aquabacter sp. CN5-332 TaxID=3156608 RepID=UPI0032B46EED
MAASISDSLFSGDGLARPVPATPTVSSLAAGLDRTLVLGGGGEYYVAWYCGFFHGLLELGVDPNKADMVVGTSAGAYLGSSLTSGHFQRLRSEFNFFGYFPACSPSWRRSPAQMPARSGRRRSISASRTAAPSPSGPSAMRRWRPTTG